MTDTMGATVDVIENEAQPEKSFCVLELHSSKSVTSVQRSFKESSTNNIHVRMHSLFRFVSILVPCQQRQCDMLSLW
jgi:hypothetical protein